MIAILKACLIGNGGNESSRERRFRLGGGAFVAGGLAIVLAALVLAFWGC